MKYTNILEETINNVIGDKYEDFKDIYRFEEEYYTDEGTKSNNKGRIDCVFVKIKENIVEKNAQTKVRKKKILAGIVQMICIQEYIVLKI